MSVLFFPPLIIYLIITFRKNIKALILLRYKRTPEIKLAASLVVSSFPCLGQSWKSSKFSVKVKKIQKLLQLKSFKNFLLDQIFDVLK